MADVFAEVRRIVDKLSDVVDGSAAKRILDKAGAAGKKAALDAAAADLGGDRRFRNFKRKAALNAGYDPAGAHSVTINFRPKGLWNLAEEGRHGSGPIRPKKGGRAVRTPDGLRARSSYGHSRGLGTFTDAVRVAQVKVPDAAADQIDAEIRRIL